jgi:S1-C subfamily serine protease
VPSRARVVRLIAFFPNRRQPLPLRLRAVSSGEDLAVCAVEASDEVKTIPVLPLETESNASSIGQDVVMMGYPSGPDRLLALLTETQSRQAQMRYADSLEGLIGYLASQNLVRPLMTRGTITDLLARRIVYDARTAEGGSGAPIFGQSGRVIGVNFAVLPSNSASNFAIPINLARELLTRAGWRSPEKIAEDDAADSPTQDAASPAARTAASPNTPTAAR